MKALIKTKFDWNLFWQMSMRYLLIFLHAARTCHHDKWIYFEFTSKKKYYKTKTKKIII